MAVPPDPPPSPNDQVVAGPPEELPPLPEDREAARKAAGRDFPCSNCGATLEFDPDRQRLACDHCGHHEAIAFGEGARVAERDLREMLQRLAQRRGEEGASAKGVFEVRCDACGANVRFTGPLTATACAYCAAPIERAGVHDAKEGIAVDGVLPFRIEEPAARQNLGKWVKSRWFLPTRLAREGIAARFQGVYLPFFTFDALTANRFAGQRGTRHTMVVGSGKRRTVVVYYTWRPVTGAFERFFDDVLESAGSGLPDEQMSALEPWPMKGLQPYSPQFLSGFLARTWEVPLDRCFDAAKRRIAGEIESDVRRRIGGDAQRVHSIDTAWPALAYKHVLLPVWLAAYRFREKGYRVVVNAATGEVQGERPWSAWKIALFIVALLAAAGAIAVVVAANS
jgi:DNA-directed RNA polymerase subunit RPC12/RpoP